MASAALANRNESSCASMGKVAYSNHNLNANPNPNPNPNPRKKQKRLHQAPSSISRYHQHNPHSNNFESPVVTQTASDDAYSFNQPSTSRNTINYGGYLTFKVSSYAKFELIKLRKRLSVELDQVRCLRSRIESGRFDIVENAKPKAKPKKFPESNGQVTAVVSVPKKLSNGYDNGSFDTVYTEASLKECGKIVAKLIKHKHGYVFRVPVDAVALGLHDYHIIVKRPMDLGTVKANLAKSLYSSPIEFAADVRLTFNNAMLYNPKHDPVHGMAEQMLTRFEELFKPIQEKLDLYMDQQKEEFCDCGDNVDLQFQDIKEIQCSSWNNRSNMVLSSPIKTKKVKPKPSHMPVEQVFKKLERMPVAMQAHSSASTASNPPALSLNQQQVLEAQVPPSPVRASSLPGKDQKVVRSLPAKLPKPKAKDPNKREMSMEEKQKLGHALQNMPQEKMPQLLHIIRKRNEHLAQDGDEIELDIEALDTETLWELDRFVTNWKKMVSKTKRQALMMNYNSDAGFAPPDTELDVGAMSDKMTGDEKKLKDNNDEDVDIDDDMPATSFPPVRIEKDEGAAGVDGAGQDQPHDHDCPDHGQGNVSSSSSSSGSSSSGSSSSSDSDSGSSSCSDSDGDDAHS